jgi:hypothetical protein
MKLKAVACGSTVKPMLHPSSFILHLISSVRQHRFDSLLVCFCNQTVNVEQSFPLVALFCQNMARVRVTTFDLTGRGNSKALRRTLMCF